jgi:prefoldin subunit 5
VLRIPSIDDRKELDQEHLAICEKIDALEAEINSLKNQQSSYEGLQKTISTMKFSRNKYEVNEELEKQISELEARLSKYKEPSLCAKEIKEKEEIITQLRKDYIRLPFFTPPAYFDRVREYRNVKQNFTIRPNMSTNNTNKNKLYLYENSQIASDNVKILLNDKNEPIEIIRYVQNSGTYGQIIVVHTPILLDVPLPPKKPNPKRNRKMVGETWDCKCGAKTDVNLQVCWKCNTPRPVPVDEKDKDSESKKGLLDKLKKKVKK